jgi:hypothetical protein
MILFHQRDCENQHASKAPELAGDGIRTLSDAECDLVSGGVQAYYDVSTGNACFWWNLIGTPFETMAL